MNVYLLHHERELDGSDDAKLIGVYASREDAEAARRRAVRLPGFEDHPEGFSIGEYEVGRDQWAAGFATVIPGSERQAGTDQAA